MVNFLLPGDVGVHSFEALPFAMPEVLVQEL